MLCSLEQARVAKDILRKRLNRPAWLRGIGIGLDQQGSSVVRVNVRQLTPEVRAAIPHRVGDVRIEVEEVGDIFPLGVGDGAPTCVPVTCEQIGGNCGAAPDGCGGVIDCGACPPGSKCGNAGPNKCGQVTSPPRLGRFPFEVAGVPRFELVGGPMLGGVSVAEPAEPVAAAASNEPATTQLESGAVYRGRAIVDYPYAVVTEGAAISELAKYGITPARVWFAKDKLPPDWPPNASSGESSIFAMTTHLYLEGTWTKPSGQYPTSGSKWKMFDHWLYKAAPKQAEPPPPPCRDLGAACGVSAECCSKLCAAGLCAMPAPAPVDLPTCAAVGMPCGDLACCEGLECGKDNGGYFKGGWCVEKKAAKPAAGDAQPPPPPDSSKLAITTAAIVVGSVVVLAGAGGAAALAKAMFARREVADARRLLDRTGQSPQP